MSAAPAAALVGLLAAGLIDQDAAHGLGAGTEEVGAAVPVRRRARAHQAQVGFVDQGGCLERLPCVLLGQPASGQRAQLLVHQGQELLGGVRVALLDGR